MFLFGLSWIQRTSRPSESCFKEIHGLDGLLGNQQMFVKAPTEVEDSIYRGLKVEGILFHFCLSWIERTSRPSDSCFHEIHGFDSLWGNQQMFVKVPTEVEDSIYLGLKVVGIFVQFLFIIDSKNI